MLLTSRRHACKILRAGPPTLGLASSAVDNLNLVWRTDSQPRGYQYVHVGTSNSCAQAWCHPSCSASLDTTLKLHAHVGGRSRRRLMCLHMQPSRPTQRFFSSKHLSRMSHTSSQDRSPGHTPAAKPVEDKTEGGNKKHSIRYMYM